MLKALKRRGLDDDARTHVPAEADAVFVGGNGLRAIGVIRALEEDLDRTVLTANQVAFWQALRCCGVRAAVGGYGRLFSQHAGRAGSKSQ
jgi:maleate isomerase